MSETAEEVEKEIAGLQKKLKALNASEGKEEVAKALRILKRHGVTYSKVKKYLGVSNKGKFCQLCLNIHGTGETKQVTKRVNTV